MDRFGNYVIERELGRGGMGVVFAARHAILGHAVALKILHEEWVKREDVVQRFFNEARAAAAIKHPGIIAVQDVGIHDGQAFLVMQLLDGESLAQRMRARGPLPVAAAVACIRQVVDALAAAHAAGIVHRDLKPDNIFITRDERVVLLDFGVAKLGSMQSDMRTKTGALLGTPYYMSPEQCDGERAIDARSDLYAIGCVMFQMITGKLPFEGGLGAVIGMHLHVAPTPVRALQPAVPPDIDAVVSRLMAKDPAARFQSAGELLAALDAWQPSPIDHEVPGTRPADFSTSETLPGPRSNQATMPSISAPPAAAARPSIKPPDGSEDQADTYRDPPRRDPTPAPVEAQAGAVTSSARRGWLLVAAVLAGGVGIGALVYALTRPSDEETQVAMMTDARASVVDAAVVANVPVDATFEPDADTKIEATRVEDALPTPAPPPRASGDAAAPRPRDAAAPVQPIQEATEPEDAGVVVDAAKPDAVAKFIKFITTDADRDWEVSRDWIVLEVEAPNDPGLPRARAEARKAIERLTHNTAQMPIHRAIVDHAWQKGMQLCIAEAPTDSSEVGITIAVQCTALACIAQDEKRTRKWMNVVGYAPMLELIGKFCERYAKP